MTKPGRVLALEVRRLRMEAIEARQKLWDWQRRAEAAEEKLEAKTPTRPTVHSVLGIPQEHAAFARQAYGDGVIGQQSAQDAYAKAMIGNGALR